MKFIIPNSDQYLCESVQQILKLLCEGYKMPTKQPPLQPSLQPCPCDNPYVGCVNGKCPNDANATKRDFHAFLYSGNVHDNFAALYGHIAAGLTNGRLYRESTPKDTSELFYEAQRLAGEPVEISFAPVPFPLSQINDGITVTLRTIAKPQHAISDMQVLQWNAPRSEHFDTVRMAIHHMCQLLRQKRDESRCKIHTLVYLDEMGQVVVRDPRPRCTWIPREQPLILASKKYVVRDIYDCDHVRYVLVRETV